MSKRSHPSVRAAVAGSLLGAACGDALGAPFEGASTVPVASIRGWLASPRPLRYTDDTAMTLVLARHLVAHDGDVDADRLARDFAEEWRADPGRGYGSAPPKIFRTVLAGGDWAEASRGVFAGAGSWGNGGAMRVAPTAHLPHPLGHRTRVARRQAAITHAHRLAQDGAAMQCAVIAAAAESARATLDVTFVLERIGAQIDTAELQGALTAVGEAVTGGWSTPRIVARLGADISAVGSVPTAVALALTHPDDLEDGLVAAVGAGGDTDTIASMVGAIVGARVGESGIPSRWLERLENGEQVREAADALASLATG